jgi:hypothetical protein
MKQFLVFAFILLAIIFNSTTSAQSLVAPTSYETGSNAQAAFSTATGMIYAGACGIANPPSWCPRLSSVDVASWITAAVTQCPSGYGGFIACTILLPVGNDIPWRSTVHLGPGVNLVGQGKFASVFRCTVAGDCLVHDASAKSGTYGHSVDGNSKYEGFRINGNGAAGQNILHLKDAQGLYVSDAEFDGASQKGGSCVWFEDVTHWTERNTFADVNTGYNCSIGWRFTADSSNPHQPHPSFGYNRFLDIKANTSGPQTVLSLENGSLLYNGTLRMTVNKGGSGSKIIHMQDSAEVYFEEIHLTGEENGSGGELLDITSPLNQFTYYGEINWTPGYSVNIAKGAILTHWEDSWAYFKEATNQFGNPVTFSASADIRSTLDVHGAANLAGGMSTTTAIASVASAGGYVGATVSLTGKAPNPAFGSAVLGFNYSGSDSETDLFNTFNDTGSKDAFQWWANLGDKYANLMSISRAGGLTLKNGSTPLYRYAKITATLSPIAIAPTTCSAQSVRAAGIRPEDIVIHVQKPSDQPGLSSPSARATGMDTVELNFCNPTSHVIKPIPEETYTFVVLQ